jgi:hypothetical protein
MSEIKFSNLIFEQQKEVLAQATNPSFVDYNKKLENPGTNLNRLVDYSKVDPKLDESQKNEIRDNVANKKIQHYIGKINTPGTNLTTLELSVDFEPSLTDLEKSNLFKMVGDKRKNPSKIVDYSSYFNTFSPAPAPDYTNTEEYVRNQGLLGRTNVYQSGAANSASGLGGTAGLGSTTEETVSIDSDSGVELDPATRSKLNLESLYSGGIEKDPVIKTRGMKPSTESIGMEQTQTLASLEAQYNETKKKINLLDKLYAQIVRNPTNLNLGSLLNAHTSAQFVKLAETEIKEADEVTEEYYDDLLPGFGTALEHPEKYRNIPTDEIKPHKAPKFIRVK